MPVYDYECASCSFKFEVRRGFNDSSDVSCPQCSSPARRVFHPVPIIFKGSGFYVTDHRTEDHRKPAKKSNGEHADKADMPAEPVKQPAGDKK